MADDRLHYEEIAEGLSWETPGIRVTESPSSPSRA